MSPPAEDQDERHLAVVIRSQEYTVIDLGHQRPVRGLGYGWECLSCDRAEACHYPSEELARAAADRHQRASRWDLMTVAELLAKLDTEGEVLGVLHPDTKETLAFMLKATPLVNQFITELTERIPPPPFGSRVN